MTYDLVIDFLVPGKGSSSSRDIGNSVDKREHI